MRKVSVIIACYNVDKYINRCLSSIEAQTIGMDNLEIICIDDASTDNTWGQLQSWERRYPHNIILIRQEVNSKQGTARNIGLQYATADWIAYVDADDWLETDYFEKLYAPVDHIECDVVCCGWERDTSVSLTYFDRNCRKQIAEETQYIVADTKEISKLLLRFKKLGQSPWAKIIHKKVITDHQIAFPENLFYEDHYWTPLLHIYTSRVYAIYEKLYHYYVNPCSVSHSSRQDYHIDWITVQMMKWADYKRRGIWEEYREELVHDALRDAWGFVLWIIMKYDDPPFSFFQLEREFIKEHVPDYRSDPYIIDFSELHRMLLDILYSPAGQDEFQQFSRRVKENWRLL